MKKLCPIKGFKNYKSKFKKRFMKCYNKNMKQPNKDN